MKRITWKSNEPRDLPKGPWDNEPDKVQWQDLTTGYHCLIRRCSMGHLCGYVAVPASHPLFNKKWEHDLMPHDSVHGGVTFADSGRKPFELVIPSEPVWWIGFDCSHLRDQVPCFDHGAGTYRDVAFCTQECTKLAAALHQLDTPDNAPS